MSKLSTLSSLALASLALASLALLALSSAASAQSPPGGTTQPSPPPMAKPSAGAPVGAPGFIAVQQKDERLASEIRGLPVKNNADETVGSISDLVIGSDGKISAVLIGVGGFLGIGASDVAMAFDAVKMSTDKNGSKFVDLSVSRETLEKAPRYVTIKAQTDAEKSRQTPGGTNK